MNDSIEAALSKVPEVILIVRLIKVFATTERPAARALSARPRDAGDDARASNPGRCRRTGGSRYDPCSLKGRSA